MPAPPTCLLVAGEYASRSLFFKRCAVRAALVLCRRGSAREVAAVVRNLKARTWQSARLADSQLVCRCRYRARAGTSRPLTAFSICLIFLRRFRAASSAKTLPASGMIAVPRNWRRFIMWRSLKSVCVIDKDRFFMGTSCRDALRRSFRFLRVMTMAYQSHCGCVVHPAVLLFRNRCRKRPRQASGYRRVLYRRASAASCASSVNASCCASRQSSLSSQPILPTPAMKRMRFGCRRKKAKSSARYCSAAGS